jgi:predicted ATPase
VDIISQRQSEFGSHAAQLIVTTHYPYLIDKLSLEDLVALYKKDGATQCTRLVEKKQLRNLLEHGELSISDLWYSGALGEE